MCLKTSFSRRKFLKRSTGAAVTLATAPALFSSVAFAETPPVPQDANGSSKSIPITRTIAKWVVDSKASNISSAVRKEAVRSVVNSVGATVGGSADDAVTAALAALSPYSGPPKAWLFGRTGKLDPLNASLVNGIGSHVLD